MSNYVKDFLENLGEQSVNLTDYEIEQLEYHIAREKAKNQNFGRFTNRLQYNPREQAFALQWYIENLPIIGLNNNNGILQDLFIDARPFGLNSPRIIEEITERDRMIVATIIQWIGSNCGMCFLSSALKRFGAKIVYNEND